jgi:rhamnogalacturonyl hydrolase YesR
MFTQTLAEDSIMLNRSAVASFVVVLLAGATLVHAQGAWDWPKEADPKAAGARIVDNLLKRGPATRPHGYPEVCAAYGSFRFAEAIGDKQMHDKLMARYGSIADEGSPLTRRRPGHVDATVWGTLPLKIYQITGEKKFLDVGLHCADYQWEKPDMSRVREENRANVQALVDAGFTSQARYWIDDMFMITGVQVNAYRATKDRKYLDRAAKTMVSYLDKLQQPNGLFYHRNPEAKFFWGRGDGWVAVGMTEILFDLPQDHPDRPRILKGYTDMMAALKQYQTESGMWRQIIDYEPSWLESSCTGMFTFAIANGVKKGWLAADEYKPVVKKAWPALVTYMDENGNMKEVCRGTNTSADIQYYMDRPRPLGDMHGQAAMIWASWAVLE